jgi:hypothetical protein
LLLSWETVVPYQAPATKGENSDFGSTLSSTLPMAAIFTRNRYIGWASIVFSVQNWLGESEETTKNSTTPGYFTIGMSGTSILPSCGINSISPSSSGREGGDLLKWFGLADQYLQ